MGGFRIPRFKFPVSSSICDLGLGIVEEAPTAAVRSPCAPTRRYSIETPGRGAYGSCEQQKRKKRNQ
jgi:hypothetical protein